MKKIYGFLGAVALLSMVACSKDADLDGPKAPEAGTGDFFMTMNIAMASSTRTQTPNQGYEVGKDFENAISSALVIFADYEESTGKYTVFATSGSIASGDILGDPNSGTIGGSGSHGTNQPGADPDTSHTTGPYTTSFQIDRTTLLDDINATNKGGADVSEDEKGNHPDMEQEDGTKKTVRKKTYYIFVVANPSSAMVTAATKGADVQQVFAKTANDKEYWDDNKFLMSSANVTKTTIYTDDIRMGTHITKQTAYKLGTVYVQRAMSRFDLAKNGNHLVFEGAGNNTNVGPSEVPNVKVEFDAVAMINMAKSTHLFKVMAKNKTTLGDKTILFGDEREADYADNWVVTPDQTSYFNPLFTNLTGNGKQADANAGITGEEGGAKFQGTAEDFESFFAEGADFTLVDDMKIQDETFEHTGHNTPASQGSYFIWRYCMENTNPYETGFQKNGNTTGVVFRAKMTGGNGKIPTSYAEDDDEKVGEAIYAYGNVILGTAKQLKEYAVSPKAEGNNDGVYESVHNHYMNAVKEQIEANKKDEGLAGDTWTLEDGWKDNNGWKYTEEDGVVTIEYPKFLDEQTSEPKKDYYAMLNGYLVKKQVGFNIYRPTAVGEEGEEVPVYYCYYLYWNRHNDNSLATTMGTMEFATVRNNVYKLSVNKILNLGHPGKTEDDPKTPDPDDPDEKDEFWIEVSCEILPWEVRINNIEF